MDGDWAHLARQLARARKLVGLTQAELADELGVGLSTVQKMERPGVPWAKISPTHRLAARFYGWSDGSIQSVLNGDEPEIVGGGAPVRSARPTDAQLAAYEALTEGMSPRAREALARGLTLDTVVVDMAGGEGPSAVLIFKDTQSDASPEEKRIYMRKWARLQRAAVEIFSDAE